MVPSQYYIGIVFQLQSISTFSDLKKSKLNTFFLLTQPLLRNLSIISPFLLSISLKQKVILTQIRMSVFFIRNTHNVTFYKNTHSEMERSRKCNWKHCQGSFLLTTTCGFTHQPFCQSSTILQVTISSFPPFKSTKDNFWSVFPKCIIQLWKCSANELFHPSVAEIESNEQEQLSQKKFLCVGCWYYIGITKTEMLVLPKEKCWYYQKRDVCLQPGPQGHQISSFCHENETAVILAQTWDSCNSQTDRSFSLFKAIFWLPISALVFGLMNSQSDWFQQEYISCRLHLWTFPGWHSEPQYIG